MTETTAPCLLMAALPPDSSIAATPPGSHMAATPPAAPPANLSPAEHRPRRVPIECGDLPFVIRRDGAWLYRGSAIQRKELVCLFASVLRREADGGWWLITPAERGRIEVEDAPFVAAELDWTGEGPTQVLSFRTNIDQVVTAGPDHPIRVVFDPETGDPTPYILVRSGVGEFGIEARIARATYYELAALSVTEWVGDRRMMGVWSLGQFFPLESPLDAYIDEDS